MKPELLTALALDELTEEERSIIEAELHTSPALKSQLESTRAFCSLLHQELGGAELALSDEQRRLLHDQVQATTRVSAIESRQPKKLPTKPASPVLTQPLIWITGLAAVGVTMLSYHLTSTQEEDPSLLVEAKDAARREQKADSESVTIKLKQAERDSLAKNNLDAPSTRIATPPPPVVVLVPEAAKPLPAGPLEGSSYDYAGFNLASIPKQEMTELRSRQIAISDDELFGDHRDSRALFTPAANLPAHNTQFVSTHNEPLSTFSADVDTASYALVRRSLNAGHRPVPSLVRLEEIINYFPYDYPETTKEEPFSVDVQVTEVPWQPKHRLARIGIKAQADKTPLGASNYVFLIDISGSMQGPDRLDLVKQSLHMLVDQLHAADRVALVTYAGSTSVVLPSTAVENKETLKKAIANLTSGGSTAGSSGIQLAYAEAKKGFIKDGVNRVLLCTDGDFNVGITDPSQLETFITQEAKSGVYLSVLGFGTGNTQDHTMETLADKGNGNYAYIDSLSEARKVLIDQRKGTLVTVAKDVKFQVEFNPFQVQSYRLLGYENRRLNKEDFNDDKKDAGEVGAGHTVTALYEIIPIGTTTQGELPLVDELKYRQKNKDFKFDSTRPKQDYIPSSELMTVKIRYKAPTATESQRMEKAVKDDKQLLSTAKPDTHFITAVAAFAMKLREDPSVKDLSWETIRELALKGKGTDALGYRGEFLQLIDKAHSTEQTSR
jgi:secreted protein with Ig-like and vWFA domain